jgi:hypothetical protein
MKFLFKDWELSICNNMTCPEGIPMIELWKRNQLYHDYPCLLQCATEEATVGHVIWSECGAKWWNLPAEIKEIRPCIRNILIQLCCMCIDSFEQDE